MDHVVDWEVDGDFVEWATKLERASGPRVESEVISPLIGAIRSRQSLVAYLQNSVPLPEDWRRTVMPSLPRPLTSAEATAPSLELHLEVAAALGAHITPVQAASPRFWVAAHLLWLEDGLLLDDWVAGLEGRSVRNTVRKTLRYIGGAVLRARGARSVFLDCPLSSVWWKVYMATALVNRPTSNVNLETVLDLVISKPGVWREWVPAEVSRVTAVSHPRVREWWLEQYLALPESERPGSDDLNNWLNEIARMGHFWAYDYADLHAVLPPVPRRS